MSGHHQDKQANHQQDDITPPELETPELVSLAEFIQQMLPFNALDEALLYPIVGKILIR